MKNELKMAAAILNFSDSEEENERDNQVKKTGFKSRNRQLKFKKKENYVKSKNTSNLIDNNKEENMEKEPPLIIKKHNVKFQANTPGKNDMKDGFIDLMNKYGDVSSKRETVTEDDAIVAEGFYLDPESMEEDDVHNEEEQNIDINMGTTMANRLNHGAEMNIRNIELQMLNEEFIPQDLESVKRTRQVLERDTIGLQLDDDSSKVDDYIRIDDTVSTNGKSSEKMKREMIQMALDDAENAVDEDGSGSILISNSNIIVSYQEVPNFNDVVNRLQSKILKLESLNLKQQFKLKQFKSEMTKVG